MTASASIVKPHHVQQQLCTSRPQYREGRQLKAVKVYTVNLESKCLLVQNIPALGAHQELIKTFSQYGTIEEYRVLDEYPCEEFTEVFMIKFQNIQSARIAKRKLDNHTFFGGSLHVCYAPEFETVQETRNKLQERRKAVARKIKQLENEDLGKTEQLQLKLQQLNEKTEQRTLSLENKNNREEGNENEEKCHQSTAQSQHFDRITEPEATHQSNHRPPTHRPPFPPPWHPQRPPPFPHHGQRWRFPPFHGRVPSIHGHPHLPPPPPHPPFQRPQRVPMEPPGWIAQGDTFTNSNQFSSYQDDEDYYGTKVNNNIPNSIPNKDTPENPNKDTSGDGIVIRPYSSKVKQKPKFVPRQLENKKSTAVSTFKEKCNKQNSRNSNNLEKDKKTEILDIKTQKANEDLRKNAAVLTKKAGPSLPEKEEERRKTFKSSAITGNESLDQSAAEIRKRVREFSAIAPPPQLRKKRKLQKEEGK